MRYFGRNHYVEQRINLDDINSSDFFKQIFIEKVRDQNFIKEAVPEICKLIKK